MFPEFMRFLKYSLFIGLAIAITYPWFFRKPVETPIRRLSTFVEAYYDKIFSPLSVADTFVPSQELIKIWASIRVLHTNASTENDRKIYATGVMLSTLLLDAISEREKYARRLANSSMAMHESPLSKPENRHRDSRKRKEIYDAGVHRSWETTATKISAEITRQYDYMRILEG